ncbi:MAG: hypothetical protein ACTSYO_03665 [Candidatus Ranarchaeia archaeon]
MTSSSTIKNKKTSNVDVLRIDKITSSTKNVPIKHQQEITTEIDCREGAVIVVQALGEKSVYDSIELTTGRQAKIIKGNVIVGVLGERKALRGFVGKIPKKLAVGDTINILNLGGVMGDCISANVAVGEPIVARVLGQVFHNGKPANIKDYAIPWRNSLPRSAPIIAISGTCMHAGKTTAACEIIKALSIKGYIVAAGKVTGVSAQRDTLRMGDYGARKTLSLTDAGLPSTTKPETTIAAALGILDNLNQINPDLIVIEFGDGILGGYSVDKLLKCNELTQHIKVHVVAANDLVAAWGAKQLLMNYQIVPDVITGPTTDNLIGTEYIEKELGVPAANATSQQDKLLRIVERSLYSHQREIQSILKTGKALAPTEPCIPLGTREI